MADRHVIRLVFAGSDEVVEVRLRPVCLQAAERKFGALKDMPEVEGSLFMAWVGMGKPGDFDEWVETIDELIAPEADEVPSVAATSPALSPPSP